MSRSVLVASPAADLYGSSLQLLQSVSSMRERDWRVVVVTPTDGPLVDRLRDLGTDVMRVGLPVLQRSHANPAGLLRLLGASAPAVRRIRELIGRVRPDVLYVNTTTLPWWLLAGRSTRTPTLCHVHEAESADRYVVRRALTTPLRLADLCIANSRTTRSELVTVQPALARRIRLIYNGVTGPQSELSAPPVASRTRLLVVGRLSARKAPHVAVEALSRLLDAGHDVELELCGTAFDPSSAYARELTDRCARSDVAGRVLLSGHVAPIWPRLESAHILIAPSLGESLGNAVIEAQLAARPVVATRLQGHLETVAHGRTGLLVPPSDPAATASAVADLLDDPAYADQLVRNARIVARERFSTTTYGDAITAALDRLAGTSIAKSPLEQGGKT